jgi:hypothetical protein
VSLFKPGDEVWYAGSRARPGTNAELHLVDERIVGHKPRTLDFARAAAMPLTTITAWEALFDGKTLKGWKEADFGAKGNITVTNGELRIGPGEPAVGIVRDGEPPARMNYEIELEAMRTEGHDFFCGLTFPVNKDPCTLICGGWGGTLVGLSSIDGLDASENQTATIRKFKEKTWYKIRLRVTKTHITAWIDDQQVLEQELAEHKISIRMEVRPCVPLPQAMTQLNWLLHQG